ncbi:hypothetical protein [Acidiphilium acidophilum]|uniref:hypothetical protein n=1 Tax=Acidiphilium acidophilum TaxID=76588 RepID=UPI002E8E7006|nr:hypothetical protein [Acidiphilium acidophilum]
MSFRFYNNVLRRSIVRGAKMWVTVHFFLAPIRRSGVWVVRLVGTAYCHNDPNFVILYKYISVLAKYAFQPGCAIERQIAKLTAKALAFRMEYLRFITY